MAMATMARLRFVFLLALLASAEDGAKTDTLAEMAKEPYMHIGYEYQLHRATMPRSGEGDLWLNYEGQPKISLQGVAQSPKFGKGTIRILLDSATKTMYVRIELAKLHRDQCLKYPFPAGTDEKDQKRLQTLKVRQERIQKVVHEEEKDWETGKVTQLLPWTDRYRLGFVTKHNSDKLLGVTLRQGKRVVKQVDFIERDASEAASDREVFQPPSSSCLSPTEYHDVVGEIDLKPPHQRSSALNDLLLMLSSQDPIKDWTLPVLLLQSCLLPGDIAVMLEDPDPPQIERWHHIAFDYSAVAASPAGHVSRSEGTIWINMENRAFRLNGNAKNTKVGELHIDLLVHGAENPTIYANIVLEDESEHECQQFDYPTLTDDPKEELEVSAKHPLQFFSISDVDGEDCGIFIAPLARGRWLHLWVDMESDNPDAFLRSEIHHDGAVLRSTKVLKWRTGEDVPVHVEPKAAWHCTADESSSRFAALDIRSMHQKSIQLEDALYSLRELSPDFSVREILGLTGDLAIVVKVPLAPALGMLRAVTFNFVTTFDGEGDVSGNFALDGRNGRVRLAATDKSGTRVTLALDVGKAVAVKIQKPQQPAKCLKLPLPHSEISDLSALPALGTGIFQKVEALGNQGCNHFQYASAIPDTGTDSLDLWYSEEDDSICQIDLQRLPEMSTVRMKVMSYMNEFMPEVSLFSDFHGDEDEWSCDTTSRRPWLHHGAKLSASKAPTSATVASMVEALGMLGVLPSQAASVLGSLSWDEALSLRTSTSGLTLERQEHGAPSCCMEDGLQVKTGLASPLVKAVNGEQQCFGSDTKTEQEWINQFASLLADPHSQVLGVCLTDGFYKQQGDSSADSSEISSSDDVMSPLLTSFGFSFESIHPLHGFSTALGGQKVTGEVMRSRHHSHGEIRVDLEHRRLYLRSTTKDFSSGIPEVTSEIIYRGDRNQLWARFRLNAKEQCWQIDTSQALGGGGRAPNPFRRGKLSGHSTIPYTSQAAQKYTFFVAPEKRVDIFVRDHTLGYLELTDLTRDVATGVRSQGWITAPLSEEIFEVGQDWQCEQELPDKYLDQLATWDLIQVFLPPE